MKRGVLVRIIERELRSRLEKVGKLAQEAEEERRVLHDQFGDGSWADLYGKPESVVPMADRLGYVSELAHLQGMVEAFGEGTYDQATDDAWYVTNAPLLARVRYDGHLPLKMRQDAAVEYICQFHPRFRERYSR